MRRNRIVILSYDKMTSFHEEQFPKDLKAAEELGRSLTEEAENLLK